MKLVAVIGYDGVEALDLFGPLEVFARARSSAGGPQAYRTLIAGLRDTPFETESGVRVTPHARLQDLADIDTIILPGGEGLRRPDISSGVATWLARHAGESRRVASVCTGVYGLAAAGLLDGRRATTHWAFAEDVRARYPSIKLEPDSIFIRDGAIYTSAGVLAGVDLALAMVEEDFGPTFASAIAKDIVVFLRRSGSQAQLSEPLKLQARAPDRLSDLSAWIAGNLHARLDVDSLASRAGMSPRHFTRRFKDTFGAAPAEYVADLRMSEARALLTTPGIPVSRVAAAVGYSNHEAFARAYRRRYGVTPRHDRA